MCCSRSDRWGDIVARFAAGVAFGSVSLFLTFDVKGRTFDSPLLGYIYKLVGFSR